MIGYVHGKWEQFSPGRRIGMLVVGLVLLLGGDWFCLVKPQIEEKKRIQGQIHNLRARIREHKQIIAGLREKKRQVRGYKRIFDRAKQLLPRAEQGADLLMTSFEEFGEDMGVQFLSFEPGPRTKHEFFYKNALALRVQGGFDPLMRYLDRLARAEQLLDIHSVKFSPCPENKARQAGVVRADMKLFVFFCAGESE